MEDKKKEEQLIKESASGSKEAFCELYGLYKDYLYRYAYYRLGNPEDAEDAVSECVLAAWKGIGSLRSSEAFTAWLFKILSNCCAGHIRKAIASREVANQLEQGSGTDTVQPSLSVELNEALSILSDEEREIVLLSVIAGMNSSEISRQIGVPAGTVRSKLSRSLEKMRSYLS